jgi:hypothetical protein
MIGGALVVVILFGVIRFVFRSSTTVVGKLMKHFGDRWVFYMVILPFTASLFGLFDAGRAIHNIRNAVGWGQHQTGTQEAKYLFGKLTKMKDDLANYEKEANAITAALIESGQTETAEEMKLVFAEAFRHERRKTDRVEADYRKLMGDRAATLSNMIIDDPDRQADHAIDLGRTLVVLANGTSDQPPAAEASAMPAGDPKPDPVEAAFHRLVSLMGEPTPKLGEIAGMMTLPAGPRLTPAAVKIGYAELVAARKAAGGRYSVEVKPVAGRPAFEVYVNGTRRAVVVRDAEGQLLFDKVWF